MSANSLTGFRISDAALNRTVGRAVDISGGVDSEEVLIVELPDTRIKRETIDNGMSYYGIRQKWDENF